jgi:hypothetical protein
MLVVTAPLSNRDPLVTAQARGNGFASTNGRNADGRAVLMSLGISGKSFCGGIRPPYYSNDPNRSRWRTAAFNSRADTLGNVRTPRRSTAHRRMTIRPVMCHRLVPDANDLTIRTLGMQKNPAPGLERSRIGKKAFTPRTSRLLRWNPTCIARRGITLSNGATDADGR